MLFKSVIATDIVTMPTRYAKILDVSGDVGTRSILYQFTFDINVTQALQKDALHLQIQLLSKKPEKSLVKPAAVMPKSFRSSTQVLEKTAAKKVKSRKSSQIAYLRTEITDVIPNTDAKKIASGKKTFTKAITRKTAPVINQNAYALPMSSSISSKKSVSLSKIANAFLSTQRDPAQIVGSRNSPPAALSFLKPADAMLAQKVMFKAPKKIIKPKLFTVFRKKATLTRRLTISEATLKSSSRFYLYVRLRSSKGVVISETGVWCNHSKILNDFLTPQIPPQLQVSQSKVGEMSIGITQLDQKAARVKLFRRVAPSSNSDGTGWEVILDKDLEVGEGDIRFRDPIASANPIMYRAVCLGINSRPAEKFSSRVITPRQEIKVDYSGKGSASAKIEASSIAIEVTDFPEHTISVCVRRYNLTLNSYSEKQAMKSPGFVQVGTLADEQIQFVTALDDVVRFVDTPAPGSIYKYAPVSYTLYGKEVIGKSAIIDFVAAEEDNAKVSLKISSPTLTSNQSSQSVSITLDGSFTEFGFQEIQDVLEDANQAGLFGSDISQNRASFASLIAYLVERQNLKTGEVESFGVQSGGAFMDSATTQGEKNVKPLEAGTRYAYQITALLRPAETLFPQLVSPEINDATLMTFTRAVQKFRGPMQLRKSTLASTARQSDSSAPSALEPSDPMLAGRTSVQATVEIAVPATVVKGSSASIEKRMDHTLVKWVYLGDMSKVDHFQIFLSSNGGYELLGTVHVDSSSMNFSYRHFIDEDVMYDSAYLYEVRPVSIKFKELTKMRTQLIESTLFAGIPNQELRNIKVIQR